MPEDKEKRLARLIVDEWFNRVYTEFGKSMAKKLFWIFMLLLLAGSVALGLLKIPQ